MALNYKKAFSILENEDKLKENIANNLQFLRKKYGLTQRQLAESTMTTRPALSKYELKENNMSWQYLLVFSTLFDVKIEDFIKKDLKTGKSIALD